MPKGWIKLRDTRKSGTLRYWTNKKRGKLRLQRVSASSILVLKKGKYLFSVEPDELRKVVEEIVPWPKDE